LSYRSEGASTTFDRGSNTEAEDAKFFIPRSLCGRFNGFSGGGWLRLNGPSRCRSNRVAIRRIARRKRTDRRAFGREPAPTRPPEPTGAASAERLQRSVRIKDLKADAGPRVDVKERLALSGVGCGRHHAALSPGSASAKPRRYSAALDAWLHAVKNARLSAFRSSIHEAI
jgi:hypothetical protein